MDPIRRAAGAYSILVSVNPLLKKDIDKATTTTKQLFEDYSTEYGSTVFSSDDAGFIELRHDFKFKGGKRSSRGPSISIKAYDVGLDFLSDLYFDFTERALRGIRDKKSEEAKDLITYFEKLRKADQEVESAQERVDEILTEELTAAARLQYTASKVSEHVTFTNKKHDSESFLSLFQSSDADEILEEIDKIIEAEGTVAEKKIARDSIIQDLQAKAGAKSLPKVYIMYGVGDNLAHWAGPFEGYLGEIRHNNDGKNETSEFIFAVDLATEQFEDSVVFDVDKKEERIKFFNKVQIPLMAYDYKKDPRGKLHFQSVGFRGHPDNFHDCIVKLISNYLFHLGIRNNLVILPNLDTMLGPLIEQCYLSVIYNDFDLASLAERLRFSRPEFDSEGGADNPRAGGPRAPWRTLEGQEREQSILGFVNALFAHQADPTTLGTGTVAPTPDFSEIALIESLISFFKPIGKNWAPGEKSRILNASWSTWSNWNSIGREIIMKVFDAIGCSYTKSEGPSSAKDPALLTELVADEEDAKKAKIKMINPFSPIVGGKVSEWKFQTIEHNVIAKISFKAAANQEEPLKDWFRPLRDLVDGINGCAGDEIIFLQEGYETDIGAKEIIRGKFGGGTYIGYCYPAAGIAVPVDSTPPYIFGDRELIRMLLYGDFYSRLLLDPRLKDYDYLSEKGDFKTGAIFDPKRFSGTSAKLADPFWRKIGPEIAAEAHHGGVQAGDSRSGVAFQYFRTIWAYLHPGDEGTSLGYYNGYIKNWKEMKKYLPDEFGINLTDVEVQSIFDQGYPMFLANTEGANIISYAFDVNKFLYGSLFGSVQEIYYNVAKRYLDTGAPASPVSPGLTVAEREAKINEIMDKLRSRSAIGGAGASLTVAPTVDTNAVADHLAQIMHMEHATGTTIVVRKGRSSSVMAWLMLFLDIFERQYIGTIKTLPFFEHSNLSTINKTALGIIKSTRRVGPHEKEDYQIADFLTGFYRILGFQHVITGSDAFSEFSVVKDVIAEFSNES
jgi:hypothetical protein